MEKRTFLDGKWTLFYGRHNSLLHPEKFSAEDLVLQGLPSTEAEVPGNFESDFERAGIIDDLFFGTNVLEAQNRENLHLWYIKKFTASPGEYILTFEGIDTVSDIFINKKKIGSTKNMLVEHKFDIELEEENEIMVHISPVFTEEAKHESGAGAIFHLGYNAGSLTVRKAPHMYGWDIMPRVLSGGIWKSVYFEEKRSDNIEEVYLRTTKFYETAAKQLCYYKVNISGDLIHEYSLRVSGKCGNSTFCTQNRLWGLSGTFTVFIENPVLWWTRDLGEPNLYDVTVELLYKGEVADVKHIKLGVRMFALHRTSVIEDGKGEFQFYINGEKLFIRGTNWVPLDALHSRDIQRLPAALDLLYDAGCNAVRMWGGNVYENDAFFSFCDEHGIAVWQDFAMGCAAYPNTPQMLDAFYEEATKVVKRLRQHPSLMLWAGDNECDEVWAKWTDFPYDPNDNLITRKVIPYVLKLHDPERIYLPSSPYVDEEAFRTDKVLDIPERHLWGPRDCFKGEFYTTATAKFASETGYHGCVPRESALQFISAQKLWPPENNEEWLTHAACMEPYEGAQYSYRIPLMKNQIRVLFGEEPSDFDTFSAMSDISQSEAMKFFVERFRTGKINWERTGIIWWNLIDGWPQFSDAVVDYYFRKKGAYYSVKAAQQPLCLMMTEPENGKINIVCANEYGTDKKFSYKITESTQNKVIAEGECEIAANCAEIINSISDPGNDFRFFVLAWNDNEKECKNYKAIYKMPVNFELFSKHLKQYNRHG